MRIIDGQADLNADGIIDTNDNGQLGGSVVIDGRFDVDGNGLIDATNNGGDDGLLESIVIGSTVTDANGNYEFSGLPNGDYVVTVTDTVAALSGYDNTSGTGEDIRRIVNANEVDIDFGYVREEATGSISGELFIDENSNGSAQEAEFNISLSLIHI